MAVGSDRGPHVEGSKVSMDAPAGAGSRGGEPVPSGRHASPPPPDSAAAAPATTTVGAAAHRPPRRWPELYGRLGLEFAVVLFGVFGALWADARVAARSERRVEAARLEALDNSVEATLADVVAYTGNLRRDRTLLRTTLTRDVAAAISEDSLELAVAVGLLGGTSQFEPQMDTYEDLRSSGELALLEADVRRSLSSVDQRLRRLAAAQTDLTTVQQLNYDPFAIANLDLPMLLGDFLDLEITPDAETDAVYRRILASREFRNLLVFRLDLLENILSETGAVEEALREAETAIRARREHLR